MSEERCDIVIAIADEGIFAHSGAPFAGISLLCLLARTCSEAAGPTAVSACITNRFGLRWRFGSSPAPMDCASGAGSGAGSAVPSMTFAASPERRAR